MRIAFLVVVSGVTSLLTSGARAADPVDFVQAVRPIFARHCWSCHGDKKQKSGLRLDVRAEVLKGGELHGPAVLPKKSDDSPLIRYVKGTDGDRMPPDGPGLSEAEIATLSRWVDEGANWPDGADAVVVDRKDHWSFKPVRKVEPPATKETAWPRGPIDRFVMARLEQEGLSPAPPADPISWLRRVTLDLTGCRRRSKRSPNSCAIPVPTVARGRSTGCSLRPATANGKRSTGWMSSATPTRMDSRSTPSGPTHGRTAIG